MTQCSLCFTEVDDRATVCTGCGAVKQLMRQRLGYVKGSLMLVLLVLGIVMGATGKFTLFLTFMGAAFFLVFSQPKRVMWVRRTVDLP